MFAGAVEGLEGELSLWLNEKDGKAIDSLIVNGSDGGRFAFQTQLRQGAEYVVTVASYPKRQACSITRGGRGKVGDKVEPITVQCYPFFRLDQVADLVVGQPDFESKAAPPEGYTGLELMSSPWGNPVFAGDKLYVSDRGSHRILVFNGLPTRNGASAAFALGPPDARGFSSPEGLSSDGERLAVADKGNHRVLLYSSIPGQRDKPEVVLGAKLDPSSSRCAPNSLNSPRSVFVGHGKLIIADTRNNRVLVWDLDTLGKGTIPPPALVLGQKLPEGGCARNDENQDGIADSAPTRSTLSLPSGVWTDGKSLLIADTGNNRVLGWTPFPTQNKQDAIFVLGQENFTSNEQGSASNKMNSPLAVASTGKQVFVADYWNNRILLWEQFPTASGVSSPLILAQMDTQQPSGMLLSMPYLMFMDSSNNRLLFFESDLSPLDRELPHHERESQRSHEWVSSAP
jgi:DNA-binding beta-propeller fold protein YncE